MDKNFEILKERVKFETEKLKMTLTFIVILAGALIGLVFNSSESSFKNILVVYGTIIDIIAIIYLVILNHNIKKILTKMEDKKS